jgi:acyl-coenzyme A thioesterase PaaI-like protein
VPAVAAAGVETRGRNLEANDLSDIRLRGVGVFLRGAGGPTLAAGRAVHGGAIASCLDSIMGQTNLLNGCMGPTAYLTVRYKRPILLNRHGDALPLGGCVVAAEGRVRERQGKKVFLAAALRHGETGEEFAVAEGLFIHQTMAEMGAMAGGARQAKGKSVADPPAATLRSGGAPKDAATAARMALGGWVNDTERAKRMARPGQQRSYIDSAFPRLHRSFWFHPSRREFAAVVYFGPQCLGPPGRVHGGCQFAVIDDTFAKMLFCRAASDLGYPPGAFLTTTMTVNYKGGVPLDSVCVVTCRVAEARIDRKGRTRLHLEGRLALGWGGALLSAGSAVFVASGVPWRGQPVAVADAKL